MKIEYSILIIICIALSAFFAGSEIAFLSLSKIRLKHLAENKNPWAIMTQNFISPPDRFLGTVVAGMNFAHITASALMTALLIPYSGIMASVYATIILTFIMLIFGEVLPKAISRRKANTISLKLILPLRLSYYIFYPLVFILNAISSFLVKSMGKNKLSTSPFLTREEFRLLLQLTEEGGEVKTEERQMIDRILDLRDTTVREIMTPLIDVIALTENASLREAMDKVIEKGDSRIPVYRDRVDNITGIATVIDLINNQDMDILLKEIVRKAYYVPETTQVYNLLIEMQKERIQFAIAVDEFGGSVGIITIEDIAEEIVGEIEDERYAKPSLIERLHDGSYAIDAKMRIGELNEALNINFPQEDYETIGGLLLYHLKRIPKSGDEFVIDMFQFKILEASEKRIIKLKLTLK